jgi:hypothetical protein
VAANGGALARNGALTVGGQSLTVNQNGAACSYTLQSPSADVPSGGGPSAVGVIAAAGCPWTATSNAPFVHITSGASSSGAGSVGYQVDANTTAQPQSGTLTIAGITFPITQEPASCAITLGSLTLTSPETGGPGSFTYTTSVSACPHTVQSFASWITVTSNPYSGTNGTVNFNVDVNPSVQRSGVIHVGDEEFTVTQNPSTCVYTLTSTGAPTFGRAGGPGTAPMSFSPGTCGPPGVIVTPASPPGMITLGAIDKAPPGYVQNFTVGLYQTFINYVRTAQLLIQGQIFNVKQTSN